MALLQAGTKTSIQDAVDDIEAAIEALGTAWLAYLAAYNTARGDAKATAQGLRGVESLNGALGPHRLRNYIKSCAEANQAGFLFDMIDRADGLGVTSGSQQEQVSSGPQITGPQNVGYNPPVTPSPGGNSDLSGTVEGILTGL